jgi:hypothetical protein
MVRPGPLNVPRTSVGRNPLGYRGDNPLDKPIRWQNMQRHIDTLLIAGAVASARGGGVKKEEPAPKPPGGPGAPQPPSPLAVGPRTFYNLNVIDTTATEVPRGAVPSGQRGLASGTAALGAGTRSVGQGDLSSNPLNEINALRPNYRDRQGWQRILGEIQSSAETEPESQPKGKKK